MADRVIWVGGYPISVLEQEPELYVTLAGGLTLSLVNTPGRVNPLTRVCLLVFRQ